MVHLLEEDLWHFTSRPQMYHRRFLVHLTIQFQNGTSYLASMVASLWIICTLSSNKGNSLEYCHDSGRHQRRYKLCGRMHPRRQKYLHSCRVIIPQLTSSDLAVINEAYRLMPPPPKHAAYFPSAAAAYGDAIFTCGGILISKMVSQFVSPAQI